VNELRIFELECLFTTRSEKENYWLQDTHWGIVFILFYRLVFFHALEFIVSGLGRYAITWQNCTF